MLIKKLNCRGQSKTLRQWTQHPKCTVSISTISHRLARGRTIEQSIFDKKGENPNRTDNATRWPFGNEMLPVSEIAKRTGLSLSEVRRKAKLGRDLTKEKPSNNTVDELEVFEQKDVIQAQQADALHPIKNMVNSLMRMGKTEQQIEMEVKRRFSSYYLA